MRNAADSLSTRSVRFPRASVRPAPASFLGAGLAWYGARLRLVSRAPVPSPRVSVCVPTYNGGAFLDQTLQSIAAQTFEDYEVIVVDDGSTDGTLALVRQRAAADPRLKLFEPSQRAGSSARNANRCLELARGEWIKPLFQDDVMAPDCLAALLDATRGGRRFALCWHDYRFEPGVDAPTRAFYEGLATLGTVLPGAYAAPEALCEAVLAHWLMNFLGPTSTSFVHRECIARYGAFSPDILTFPDLECWIRIGSNEGVAIAAAHLVTFRVHAKSISAGLRNDAAAAYRHALERVVLCEKFAFAPEYARMRAYMQARSPALDPLKLLTKQAKGARWLAVDAKHRNDDAGLLERWEAFERDHPQVVAILREADTRMTRKFFSFAPRL